MTYNNTPYFSEDFYVGDRPMKSSPLVKAKPIKRRHSVLSTLRNVAPFSRQICYLSKL